MAGEQKDPYAGWPDALDLLARHLERFGCQVERCDEPRALDVRSTDRKGTVSIRVVCGAISYVWNPADEPTPFGLGTPVASIARPYLAAATIADQLEARRDS